MRAPRRSRVRVAATALALTLLTVGVVVLTSPAASAAQYRYWTYWWGRGTGWQYASLGPAYDSARIGDGFVLGWRFGTTGPNGGGAQAPRYDASVPCHAKAAGQIGVALVIDFGTAADVPPGDTRPLSGNVLVTCVSVPAHSNGAQVLAAARVSVRTRASDNLVCGLDGYPSTECAALVADPAPAPTRASPPARTPSPPTGAGTPGAPPTRTPVAHGPSATVSSTPSAAPSRPSAPASASPSPSGTVAGVVVPEQTLPAAPAGALATQAQGSTGSPWPVAGVVLLVAALGAGTWWTRRRST